MWTKANPDQYRFRKIVPGSLKRLLRIPSHRDWWLTNISVTKYPIRIDHFSSEWSILFHLILFLFLATLSPIVFDIFPLYLTQQPLINCWHLFYFSSFFMAYTNMVERADLITAGNNTSTNDTVSFEVSAF